jgi:hypothetical protein
MGVPRAAAQSLHRGCVNAHRHLQRETAREPERNLGGTNPSLCIPFEIIHLYHNPEASSQCCPPVRRTSFWRGEATDAGHRLLCSCHSIPPFWQNEIPLFTQAKSVPCREGSAPCPERPPAGRRRGLVDRFQGADQRTGNSLFRERNSLLGCRKFPAPAAREFAYKALESLHELTQKIAQTAKNLRFP